MSCPNCPGRSRMIELAPGVLKIILKFLDPRDLCSGVASVCTLLREETDRTDQWVARVRARWPFVDNTYITKFHSFPNIKSRWKAAYFHLNSQVSVLFAKLRNDERNMVQRIKDEREMQENSLRLKLLQRRVISMEHKLKQERINYDMSILAMEAKLTKEDSASI
uniref:F-box domain-containing protein n=1 Tax=Lotharella oceanica TaxID=641309 RepID=A0A7S2TRK6_9EUKA